MNSRRKLLTIIIIPLAAALIVGVGWAFFANNTASAEETGTTYEVTATNARLVRQVTGDVTESVQGIPAEPVDSFAWDGEGVEFIDARATLKIDPIENTGKIEAEWTDPEGNEWTLEQTAFLAPEHASGFVIDPDVSGETEGSGEAFTVSDDPITQNVYLHGATMAGGPVLPRVLNHLATWGPAEVTLNGEEFENPYDGPAPRWITHTMTTLGVRQANGTVSNADGDGYYNPMDDRTDGAVDYSDLEFHMVFHDAPGPETENFPPPLSFFYHIQFEDVQLEVKSTE